MSVDFAAWSPPTPQPPDLRLLLDQGFPSPPGFTVRAIDHTVEAVSLYDFDSSLAENSTPDWAIYCIAARAGFDALVTRDQSQLRQSVEMFVLSRLRSFTVITWRNAIEDPVREWGQLLAYLPEVKKLFKRQDGAKRPNALLLPAPTLGENNLLRAADAFGMEVRKQDVSHAQAIAEARAEIVDWLEMTSRPPDEFDQILGLRSR